MTGPDIKRENPSVVSFLVIMVTAVAIVYYLVMALNTGDVAWFSSRFSEKPLDVIVHCYGGDVVLRPGETEYTELNNLVNRLLSGKKRWDPLTLSQTTYRDYQSDPLMMVLEMTYAPPVRVHSGTKYFSNVDTLVIPLEGRHAQYNALFGRNKGVSSAGAFFLEATAPLKEYLAANRLCPRS